MTTPHQIVARFLVSILTMFGFGGIAGTAVEITPIRSVDKIQVGSGRRGPITTNIQAAFFDYINGVVPDRHGWLLPVPVTKPTAVAAGR